MLKINCINELKLRFPARWWLVGVLWLLITLAIALESNLIFQEPFHTTFLFHLCQWVPWAVFSPFLFWVTDMYPVERNTWRRNLWPHILAFFITTLGFGLLWTILSPPPIKFSPPPAVLILERDHPGYGFLLRSTIQLPTYLAVIGLAHAFTFYKRAREKEERESELLTGLARARLEALQMQINPHFLFNTLNSISSLIAENPKAADEMIVMLSDLFRKTLKISHQQEITLREELSYMQTYLAIQKVRFGERLQVFVTVDESLLEANVPVLLFQPLVENAIKHGIEPRIEPGTVWINAQRDQQILRLEVRDDGVGLKTSGKLAEKSGFGLSNVMARLDALYGSNAGLSVEEPSEGGFMVKVKIPWRINSPLVLNNKDFTK